MSGNLPGPSNALLIQIPGYFFAGLCPIALAVRFGSRLRSQTSLGSDDWTILAALVSRYSHNWEILGFGESVKCSLLSDIVLRSHGIPSSG
jgi:hypothetical protein